MSQEFKHILVPVDFSEDSEHAMETAISVFGNNAESITILTVYEGAQSRYTELSVGNEVDSMMGKSANEEIEKFKEKFSNHHSNVNAIVKKGNPAAKIITTAKELHCDLIVMGSQGRNALARVFFGNTTYQVARKAHCSIFVIRD